MLSAIVLYKMCVEGGGGGSVEAEICYVRVATCLNPTMDQKSITTNDESAILRFHIIHASKSLSCGEGNVRLRQVRGAGELRGELVQPLDFVLHEELLLRRADGRLGELGAAGLELRVGEL